MIKDNVILAKPLEFVKQKRLKISGFDFVQVSKSYPESYDVFDCNGNQIGHVRLRWGCVSCWLTNGKKIYEAFFESEYVGEFDNDEIRCIFLNDVADSIMEAIGTPTVNPHNTIECIKSYCKYGTTFAHKGDVWGILGRIDKGDWILKLDDGAIQIIDSKKFAEHFGVEIITPTISICTKHIA